MKAFLQREHWPLWVVVVLIGSALLLPVILP